MSKAKVLIPESSRPDVEAILIKRLGASKDKLNTKGCGKDGGKDGGEKKDIAADKPKMRSTDVQPGDAHSAREHAAF